MRRDLISIVAALSIPAMSWATDISKIAFYDLEWKMQEQGVTKDERESIIAREMARRLEEEPLNRVNEIYNNKESKIEEIIEAAKRIDPEHWRFYAAIASIESSAGIDAKETRFCHTIFQIYTKTFLDIVDRDQEYRSRLKKRFDPQKKIKGKGSKYMRRLYKKIAREATVEEQVELASKLIRPILKYVDREFKHMDEKDRYKIAAAIYNGGMGHFRKAYARAKKEGKVNTWEEMRPYAASHEVMDNAYRNFGRVKRNGKWMIDENKRNELLRRKHMIYRYYVNAIPKLMLLVRRPKYARSD